MPADFQDVIRNDFPLFERINSGMQLAPNMQLPKEVAQIFGQSSVSSYKFMSEDKKSTISLSPDSLSLSVKTYSRWEDFIGAFCNPILYALENIYKPSFYTRIGLRYRDFIDREELGLAGEPWNVLLQDHLLGELGRSEFEAAAIDAKRVLRLRVPGDRIVVLLQHGIASAKSSGRIGYMIDFDFSCADRTDADDVQSTLDALHNGAGQAFRWCIKDKLHTALGPVPVP